MRLRSLSVPLSLLALGCSPSPPAASPRAAPAFTLTSVARDHVRPLPLPELLHAAASVLSADVSADGKSIVYASNRSGRINLWIADVATGTSRQLTRSDQRQWRPAFSPDGSLIAFDSDHGGDELWDLFVVKPDGSGLENLTNTPEIAELVPRFSPDGRSIAYLSKAKTAPAMEIEILDLTTRAVRKITSGTPAGRTNVHVIWSHDGKKIAYTESDVADRDATIFVVDLATMEKRSVTPHQGEHVFEAEAFSPDDRKLLVGSNAKDGRHGVAIVDLATLAIDFIVSDAWESEPGAFSPDGDRVFFTHNVDGSEDLSVIDLRTRAVKALPIPRGMNGLLAGQRSFNKDGSEIFYRHIGPDAPGDVRVLSLATGQSRDIVRSLPEGFSSADFVEPQLVHYPSRDGRFTISAFVYVPYNHKPDGHGAGLVWVHGGPSGQFTNGWNRGVQYLVSRGYVVIAPNFRGSTGYGDAFKFANRRDWGGGDLEDVRQAAVELARTGFVDEKKIGIIGGSYGGYMTMMALTKQPDVWAAGVSIVPFVNLFTEFEREDPELREYDRQFMGNPDENKALWFDRSPVNFLDRVRAPVILFAGANDPRDPPTESEQVADAIKKRGGVVELVIYKDEGHAFVKVENQIDQLTRTAAFLEKWMPPR